MHCRPKPLIAGALAAALCVSGSGRVLAQAGPASGEAELGLETCELVVPGTPLSTTGQCGWLEVAENPAEPHGRQIRIRVARVPARDRVVEPDPLVFFAGGPGQAATETWPVVAHALRKVNQSRDILLVDQRGTGQSNPLKCPEIEVEEALATDWDELARATRECLASLDGDPRFYTTTVAMHDIDAARAALGYEKVNLYGGSYGTRAAQVRPRAHRGTGQRRAADAGAGHGARRQAGPGPVPGAGWLRRRPRLRQGVSCDRRETGGTDADAAGNPRRGHH